MHPEIGQPAFTDPVFPRRDLLRRRAWPVRSRSAGTTRRLRQAIPPAPPREGVHRALHVGRAGPAGHLGHEAGRAGRVSRRVQADPDERSRPADLRAPADAGPAGTRAVPHPLDDAQRRQPPDRARTTCSPAAGARRARSATTGRTTARCWRSRAAAAGRCRRTSR